MCKKFDHVLQHLLDQKLEQPGKISSKELSILCGQLIQFMEDYLGAHVCKYFAINFHLHYTV